MKRPQYLTGTLMILAACSACAVGPDYREPDLALPAAFHESETEPAAADCTKTGAGLLRWWEDFHDPVLNELIAQGVDSNLDVQLAAARVREARSLLSIARAELIPSLNTTGSYSRSKNSKNGQAATSGSNASGTTDNTVTGGGTGDAGSPSTISPQERNLFEAGFDSEWEIDLFGGKRRAIESADYALESQMEGERDALVTLLSELAQNYILLRGLQHQYEIAERNLTAQRDTLDVQKMRFEAGVASDLTVAQAQAQLADTESALPTLLTQIKKTIHRMSVLLGGEPGMLAEKLIVKAPIPHGPEEIPPGLPSELLRRRPDVRRTERLLAAATANIGVAVADLFPKLTLTGKVGLRSEDLSSIGESDSLYWSAGPSITLPIFAIAAIRANINVRTARQEQALIQYQQVVLQSLEDVENALTAYREEQNRLDALVQSVEANRRAVDLAKQLNSAGVVDFLNVLTAQQALYQSEGRLAESEQTVALNSVALYKALGGGWETFEDTATR